MLYPKSRILQSAITHTYAYVLQYDRKLPLEVEK
jgi:hypothetical protein